MRTLHTMLTAAATVILGGCATPHPALDQANHTTALMGSLERELATFRRTVGAAQEARQDSMHQQKLALISESLISNPRVRARKSAGDVATQVMIDHMLADADSIASDEEAGRNALAANDAAIAKIMTPLASTSTLMTEAQTKMAVMGNELPASIRAKELFAFAKAIKENVAKNREKIDAAGAAAAASK